MANRNMNPARQTGVGEVNLNFSFLCNTAADPVSSGYRGDMTYVASIVHTATGRYTVTLVDKWRYVIAKNVDLEDSATGGSGDYATIGAPANEGSASTAVSFLIHTRTVATGAEADFASPRRVSVRLVLKNSSVGT